MKGLVVAALASTMLFLAPGRAQAAACQSSGPSGGAYTVNVCLTAPADGATIGGPTNVTVTVSVTGTTPGIRRVAFYLDGQDLLTDYQAPYTFTLPSQKFVDGAKTLSVEAWMRDGFITQQASMGLTFANGNVTPPVNGNSFTPTAGTNPQAGRPFVVAAAGDGAGGESSENATTNLIGSWNPNLFLYLGDVYENGTSTEFYNWYRSPSGPLPTNGYYGRFNSITDPTVGNHEYTAGQAPGYFDYWNNVPHYYSYNTHGWHLISLDANSAFNQTAVGSDQYNWLANDLDTNTQPCTLVYYHEPLYNIGEEGPSSYLGAFWSLFAQHGVDLVVNGHDHTYQRWMALDGAGNASPSGVTQLIAGAGGHALGVFVTSDSRVAATATQFGALRLELNGAGAGYQFDNTSGRVLDSGSVQCDPSATDGAAPTTPSDLTAIASYKTKVDLTWSPAIDNVGVTGYEIYRDGQPLVTVGPQASYSDTSVAPGSTHTYKVRALDAAQNSSAFSNDATATTPTVAVLFHDGFESGDLSNWTSNSGLATQQDSVFAGSWAAEATATGGAGASAFKQLDTPETSLYYVARFNILSQTTNVNLLRFRNGSAAANAIATLFVSSTGKLGLRNDVAGVATTSTTTVGSGWHTAQVHVTINGTSSSTEVWLDGNAIASLSQSGINLGTNAVGRVELGDPSNARTYDVALDEVAYDRDFIGDVTPPTKPTNLSAVAHSGLEVDLSWTPGTDDVGITGYDLYRNGSLIATVAPGSSYADKTASPLTSYTYRLVSRDAAGNVSDASDSASATTGDVFTDDFESGMLLKWTTVAGLSPQMTNVDGGQWGAEAASDGTSGASAQTQLDATVNQLYYRARFKVLSQGPNSVSLLRFRTAANGAIASAFIASTGRLGFRNDTTSTSTTSSLAVAPGVWHEVQMRVLVNDTSSQVDLWLDGVSAISQTDSLGVNPIGRLELGDPGVGRTFDVAFDNVVADPMFIADAAVPSAPSNLHSTGTTANSVSLAWDAASDDVGVTAYRVYRGTTKVGEVDGSTLAFTDTGLNESTQYAYHVTAADAVGHESAASNTTQATTLDATAPSAPTGLSATAVAGQNRINLSWTAATDNVGVTGYRIYRNGSSTPLDSVNGSTTTYSDTTVAAATQYSYTVTAIDAASNESAASNTATATSSDTVAPTAPTTVTATTASDTQINLAWSGAADNVGVTGYQILRNGSQIATVGASPTTYSNTGLTGGTTYTYTVKAVDAAGNVSSPSSGASATTTVFTDGFETGNLSKWTSVSGLATQNTNVFAGLWAAEAQSNKNTVDFAVKQLPSTYSSLYYRLRLKVLQGKKDTIDVLRLRTASGANLLSIFYDNNRNLGLRNDTRNTATSSTTPLAVGIWYEVKVHLVVNGATSSTEVWLNGTKITALSKTDNFGTTPIGQVLAGESTSGHAYDYALDDVWADTNP